MACADTPAVRLRYRESVERGDRAIVAGYVAAGSALALFGWIARHVLERQTIRFDALVRAAVHAWASPALTDFFRVISWVGSAWFLLPFVMLFAWRLAAAGRGRAAWLYLLSAIGAEVLDAILKLAFHRPRPEPFFGYPLPPTYSFPSGHSLVSASVFGVAAALGTSRMKSRAQTAAAWIGAAALTLAIGISRIYLGVHYASDVAAGYAAAVIWVAAVRTGYRVWARRHAR